jgi:hypothetical protein
LLKFSNRVFSDAIPVYRVQLTTLQSPKRVSLPSLPGFVDAEKARYCGSSQVRIAQTASS